MPDTPSSLPYDGISLVSDPVHGYLSFVDTPAGPSGYTERDLIDHPWVQRLRSIYQLQSARFVFPSAEHTRFSHSLGAMHVAGRFARQLHPALADRVSLPFFETLLRVAALLHDTGHGPFCHFFDENVGLPRFGRSHEQMSQILIRGPLRPVIERIDRGLSGPFAPGERLSADWIAYLVGKGKGPNPVPGDLPLLEALKPLFSGIFTVDNLDYVLRDTYMCGVSAGPVDLERLLYYTHFQKGRLVLHRAGLGVFEQFIQIRRYMYAQIYFHRTTRAFDLSLRELLGETLQEILPDDPASDLDRFRTLTDHFLLEHVRDWPRAQNPRLRRLGEGWRRFIVREKSWELVYERVRTGPGGARRKIPDAGFLRKEAEKRGYAVGDGELAVDVASRDARPENPTQSGESRLEVYDPLSGQVGDTLLAEMLEGIPVRQEILRVFGKNLPDLPEASRVFSRMLDGEKDLD
ncbi:MAG: HD domain-containing protein [Nitrospirae bacterium]|nr:HD domain-containing protein [Nitrospirota bacterium]MCL5285228.1 HD domain-containing protein [Nitrospirota bacterium]